MEDPKFNCEVKNAYTYTPVPLHAWMAWCFTKYKSNFTFTVHVIECQYKISRIVSSGKFVVKSVEASVSTVESKLMSKNNTVNVTLCRLQRAVTVR
jgi:hypothetical protein